MDWSAIIIYGAFFAILIAAIAILIKQTDKQWKVVAEGIYVHSDYGGIQDDGREGRMKKITRIYFSDGRKYALEGIHVFDFMKGTPIRIKEDQNGIRVIEKIKK